MTEEPSSVPRDTRAASPGAGSRFRSGGPRPAGELPRYPAPALEKGLDILELLAVEPAGIAQGAIARRLGRTVGEIFRMLSCLERRGYIRRNAPDDSYALTLRLFELAHRHPPTQRLLSTALPVMRRLAEATVQSCHLGVYHDSRLLVVAQVESPAPSGFLVRLGAHFPLLETSSGRVLLAHQPADIRARWLAESTQGRTDPATQQLIGRIEGIAKRGYEQIASGAPRGITDISAPVRNHMGHAVAALAVPHLGDAATPLRDAVAATRRHLLAAAADITAELGGPAG